MELKDIPFSYTISSYSHLNPQWNWKLLTIYSDGYGSPR